MAAASALDVEIDSIYPVIKSSDTRMEFLFNGTILPRQESLEECNKIRLLWVSTAGINDKEFKSDHFVSLEHMPSAEPLVDQLGSTSDERQKSSCKGQANRTIDDFLERESQGKQKQEGLVLSNTNGSSRFTGLYIPKLLMGLCVFTVFSVERQLMLNVVACKNFSQNHWIGGPMPQQHLEYTAVANVQFIIMHFHQPWILK